MFRTRIDSLIRGISFKLLHISAIPALSQPRGLQILPDIWLINQLINQQDINPAFLRWLGL